MPKKVTMTHIYKLQRIIGQLETLQAQLPEGSDAKMHMEPGKRKLIEAVDMLKAEYNADR